LKALREVVPDNLSKFVVSVSGAEANEDALKIARMYKSPAYKVVARYESYHGSSAGAISLTGDPRRVSVELHTNVRGTVFAPDPYCYRCPFGLSYPECGLACAEYVDYMVRREGNVAAIFMEPVTGTNGVIVPPPGYYERLREIADEHGLLLILMVGSPASSTTTSSLWGTPSPSTPSRWRLSRLVSRSIRGWAS